MLKFSQSSFGGRNLAVVAAVFGVVAAQPAFAITSVTSDAYGLFADLRVLNVVTAAVGPVSPASGSAPANYSANNQVLSLNTDIGLGTNLGVALNQHLQTGVLTSTASGSAATPAASASATVNDVATGLTTQLFPFPGLSILGLGATTIASLSSVGSGAGLTAMGSSSIEGLLLSGTALGALTIDGSLFANAAPNTVVLDLLGLRIIANEQIFGGNGITDRSIETNAFHINFTNFLLDTQLLNGDIIIAHSAAAIHVDPLVGGGVPEPAVWLEMIAGFGIIGAVRRGRGRAVAA